MDVTLNGLNNMSDGFHANISPLRSRLDGQEFDWFAIDAEGYLGHFSSAGCGPVPVSVLEHFAEANLLNEAFLGLPRSGQASGQMNGNSAEWLDMARRGVYSFDWGQSGPYRCIATPCSPVHVSRMPPLVAASPALVNLYRIRFRDLVELLPEDHCACE